MSFTRNNPSALPFSSPDHPWKQSYRRLTVDGNAPFPGFPGFPGEGESLKDVDDPKFRLMHKLHFFANLILGIDLLVVIALSALLTLPVHNLPSENTWRIFFENSKGAIATVGAFYSFALVFRTNICYARWWEGRTIWGTLIVTCVKLSQQARLWIENERLARRLGCLAITFAYASKAQLRGNKIQDEEEDGDNLVNRGVLHQEELDLMAQQSAWQPYYCIDAMRAAVHEGIDINDEHSHMKEWVLNAAQSSMEDTIGTLSSHIGGCIRVRSTGLPTAYDDIMYTTGGIFFIFACLAWAPGCGLYTPVVITMVYIIVKMIIGVGSNMEDPFGHDESDLPLGKFCREIERQINATDQRRQIITYNLALGPPSLPRNFTYGRSSVFTPSHVPKSLAIAHSEKTLTTAAEETSSNSQKSDDSESVKLDTEGITRGMLETDHLLDNSKRMKNSILASAF
mmetsp:Transcript_8540/g.14823  ORF Transcript_8540/g.14823 Transcript_8540/m.14823 type:complete len:455 (-) Transcript_8540:326-1690(-)|eukprot:CAMPEP_0183732708 /NCGR_PEP_ID=MMETSP0737-20130205/39140_1 /TAXON_ID=385413 /ORGANISM="Thalassiosira miniscula, Strain CCMP1093" /LENGTH=454 /DNA_ID=CAMNT_0025965789 /DNA_START=84 /DNA_END=1448 /DNA_ORIENTATION=+